MCTSNRCTYWPFTSHVCVCVCVSHSLSFCLSLFLFLFVFTFSSAFSPSLPQLFSRRPYSVPDLTDAWRLSFFFLSCCRPSCGRRLLCPCPALLFLALEPPLSFSRSIWLWLLRSLCDFIRVCFHRCRVNENGKKRKKDTVEPHGGFRGQETTEKKNCEGGTARTATRRRYPRDDNSGKKKKAKHSNGV